MLSVSRRLTSAASRSTVSREVAKHHKYRAIPISANKIVVIVSERCRSPPPEIWGELTTASMRIVRLAETARALESFARSSGSWVIAAASEP